MPLPPHPRKSESFLLSSTFACTSLRGFPLCNCSDMFACLFLHQGMSFFRLKWILFIFRSSTTVPGTLMSLRERSLCKYIQMHSAGQALKRQLMCRYYVNYERLCTGEGYNCTMWLFTPNSTLCDTIMTLPICPVLDPEF